MTYTPPITADELRAEREAAAEAGITVDDWRAARAAEAADRNHHEPRIPLDPHYIEIGRRNLAKIRAELNTRKANP